MNEFIMTYRGYTIYKVGDNSFEVRRWDMVYERQCSAWSCIHAIDERESP